MPTASRPRAKFNAACGCSIKFLPAHQWEPAAARAVEINPTNAPPQNMIADLMAALPTVADAIGGGKVPARIAMPKFIAISTGSYWGPKGHDFSVQFLDSPTAACRRMILEHMNAWRDVAKCNVSFREVARDGEVRISRGPGGFWSYLGTDILSIAAGRPTMNLQGFTENTPLSEYKRVVRHETGHTLGCPHEHMRQAIINRLDVEKTVDYFQRNQGWPRAVTVQQVLTALEERSLMASPTTDADSVMCYALPGSITKDGRPIVGGTDITANDARYMSQFYPMPDAIRPPAEEVVSVPVTIDALGKLVAALGYKLTKG